MIMPDFCEVFVDFKKLHPDAKKPEKVGDLDNAGYDLFALEHTVIKPGERALVRTGIAIKLPKGSYGRIAPRSGLALKNGIDVMAGVIDCVYTGEIGVILINLNFGFLYQKRTAQSDLMDSLFGSREQFTINKGDRIAQLIIESYYDAIWREKDELSKTVRGVAGFGSSSV